MALCRILIILTILSILSIKVCYASSLQDGMNAYNQGKYTVAEYNLKNAMITDPGNVNLRYYLAITEVQLGKYTEAKKHYQYIINNAPGTNTAYWANVGLKMISGGSTSGQTSITKVTIPIEEHNSVIQVKNVKLNNSINANFIVDTGATFTIISSNIASQLKLNLTNTPKITLITANGPIKASKTTLSSIEINGLVAKNVEVAIADVGVNSSINGLLGMSFLNKFKVTIDKTAGKLTLEKP
jgi:clan AA aspartic protease (TIGR02281 family)